MSKDNNDLQVKMSNAKQAFVDLIYRILKEIEQIDQMTPWQENESKWWLDMMKLKKFIQKIY